MRDFILYIDSISWYVNISWSNIVGINLYFDIFLFCAVTNSRNFLGGVAS